MSSDMPDVTMISDSEKIGVVGGDVVPSSLVMIYGEYLGRRFEVNGAPIIIGRSPECTVQLVDDSVSRRHCRINPGDHNVVLFDLNSTNGTYVNGTAVSARPLKDGDKVQIGRSIFKFLSGRNIEHAYHEEIRRELHRFYRYTRPLALVMFDIDLFKNVNDTYGHLAGDRVLSEIGELLASIIRREDTLCRYGGEEFALLAPEMGLDEGIALAEQVRAAVESHTFTFDGAVIPLTISAGVAVASEGLESPDEFVAEADRCLYLAKNNGRNRVEPRPSADA